MSQHAPAPATSVDDLRRWLRSSQPPHATVYLSLQRGGAEARQNGLLVEQAAREIETRLLARGVPTAQASDFATRLRAVETHPSQIGSGAAGLAVLVDTGSLHAVPLAQPVPFTVSVGATWSLRPLLAALHRVTRYRVLALSVKRVALFEGGPEALSPVELPGIPKSLADALGEETTEKELRVRGTGPAGASPAFYSHGSGKEERKLDLTRFHEALARALSTALEGPWVPLVLAATQQHQGGLRALGKLPGLLEEGITGNPDRLTPAVLHARAWPVVERWLATREDPAPWERARNRGKGVDLLDDACALAVAGRVRRLWLDSARSSAGRLDPETGRIGPGAPDDDVFDALAEAVLVRGGDVIPLSAAAARSLAPTGIAAELH
jgi:hypothetical protein